MGFIGLFALHEGLSLEGRPACGAGRSTPLRRSLRDFPAVLAFRGVSLELASLKQSRALIRERLRSSAPQRGSPDPHHMPGLGVCGRCVRLGGGGTGLTLRAPTAPAHSPKN